MAGGPPRSVAAFEGPDTGVLRRRPATGRVASISSSATIMAPPAKARIDQTSLFCRCSRSARTRITISANIGMCLTRKRNCISLIGGRVSQGHNGGAARAVVDQRHFAENAIGAESFEATVPGPDLDLSADDNKELVALFALPEDLRQRISGSGPPASRED